MDANYSFYLHMENLKNSLYRQLSSARQPGLFWPKFYYSWYYADEKTLYNLLNLRQKLGVEITDNEISTYNHMRSQMNPPTPFVLRKKNKNVNVEGNSIKVTDIYWTRSQKPLIAAGCLSAGVVAHQVLKMTRWWYIICFIPVVFIHYMDKKFAPYGEIENFYKYVWERRKAETLFKQNEKEIESELLKLDQDNYLKLRDELLKSNTTLYEVTQDLDEYYLTAAIRSDTKH